jgi:hypothetical protein
MCTVPLTAVIETFKGKWSANGFAAKSEFHYPC